MATDAWRAMRAAGTVSDPLMAAIATSGTLESTIAAIPEGQRRAAKDLAEAHASIAELDEIADALREMGGGHAPKAIAKRLARIAQERGDHEAKAEGAQTYLDEKAGARRDAVRRAVRVALVGARAEAEDVAGAEAALGGRPLSGGGWGAGTRAGPGGGAGQPIRDRIALAQRLRGSGDLAAIVRIAGRMRRIAQAVRETRVDRQPAEITSVTVGDDLARLLPSELALLGDPALEPLFDARYTERALLVYETHGTERAGRGPIIYVEDESASMTEVMSRDGTTRHQWAKALGLTILAIARQERRDLHWFHFASTGECDADFFPQGRGDPAKVMAAADHFYRGGTEYETWMALALNLVANSQPKADVILASDGVAAPGPETLRRFDAARTARGMRVYSILLGTSPGALTGVSDAVYPLASLTGDDADAALMATFAI
jgi:uncharacterized protein with von Willebrand factor type A (vWA) domain